MLAKEIIMKFNEECHKLMSDFAKLSEKERLGTTNYV